MRFLGLASTLLLLLLFTSLSHCQDINDEDFGSDDEMALPDDMTEMEESDGKEMNETKPIKPAKPAKPTPAKPEKKEEEKEENKGEKEESKEENKEDKKEDNKEKEGKEEVESVDAKKCPFVCTKRKILKKSAGSSGAKIIILTSAGRGRHRSLRNHFLHRGGPFGMSRFGNGPFNRFRGPYGGPFRGPFRFRHHHRRVFPEEEEVEGLENESAEEKPTATAEENEMQDEKSNGRSSG